jgi:tetratricopeptide (TPR) repeat protein
MTLVALLNRLTVRRAPARPALPALLMLLMLLVLLAVPGGLRAQDDHAHHGPPPERLGRVNFPADCRPAVRARFERAVALLHSFWYEEAARTFAAVGEADSTCALAEWGMAMSTLHPLWTPPTPEQHAAARAHAERAVELSRPGTRPRDYAEAIAAYYRGDGVPDRTRLAAYEQAMAGVARRWPRDEEARIFHALALIALGQQDAGDSTYARQREAARILEPLFRRHPDHPGLAHYLIHAYDSPPLAHEGERAADRYAAIAPSVPHAQHMPSHIYTRIGAWDKAIGSNLRSVDAARRFEESQLSGALWDQDAHALDYLAYAYLQLGRVAEVRHIADRLARVRNTFPPNSRTTDYALAAIPARLALERDDWQAAAALPVRPAPAWRGTEGLTRFARALGAARLGNSAAARAEVDTLGALERNLAAIGGPQAYWSTQVRVQRLAAGAWVDLAAGDTAAARPWAAMAPDLDDGLAKHPVTPGAVLPARELYGDLLAAVGRRSEAVVAYQRTLARQPGRARAAADLARMEAADRR